MRLPRNRDSATCTLTDIYYLCSTYFFRNEPLLHPTYIQKAMKHVMLFSLIAFILISCTHRTPATREEEAYKKQTDSLEELCFSLVDRLNVDSLRAEATYFMSIASPGTYEYFRARQFYINSWFNAKDYPQVLAMLNETEAMPGFASLPACRADYAYTRARCYQFMGRPDDAIATFRRLMDIEPTPGDTSSLEATRKRIVEAMNHVTNIFYFSGHTSEGSQWFQRLRTNPPALVGKYCERDMRIFEAYLKGLHQSGQHSALLMDSALACPTYRRTSETDFRDYSLAASVYYSLPEREQQTEQLLKQAIAEGQKHQYLSGISWAMNLLGDFYGRKYKFNESVQLQYQGLAIGVQQNNSAICVNSFLGLSNIYNRYKLYPQADYYASKAIAWITPNTPLENRAMPYMLKFRLSQKLHQGKPDMNLLNVADSCYEIIGDRFQLANNSIFRAEAWVKHYPDSLNRAVELLNKLPSTLSAQNWNRLQYSAEALRTIALLKQGREAEARKSLLNIKDYLNDNIIEYLDILLNHYLRLKDTEAIAHLTRLREPLLDEHYKWQARQAVIAADIRYQTQQKEQQNQLLSAEIALKESSLRTYSFAGLALLLVVIGIGCYFSMRQYSLHLRLQLKEQEKQLAETQLQQQEKYLQRLIASRQEVNNHNEALLRQLTEVQASHEKSCNLDRVMENLQPRLLTSNEETQFREAFNSLYPTALHRLRSACSKITRTDELLCMLIILKQTNDDISHTLGISRPSVFQTRYRLRVKLNLTENTDLDSEVRRIAIE